MASAARVASAKRPLAPTADSYADLTRERRPLGTSSVFLEGDDRTGLISTCMSIPRAATWTPGYESYLRLQLTSAQPPLMFKDEPPRHARLTCTGVGRAHDTARRGLGQLGPLVPVGRHRGE